MRFQSKKIKILLMIIIITIIMSISKVVFGLTISPIPAEPYMYDPHVFCINHTKGYALRNVPGMDLSTRIINYDTNETKDLEQSVAFAIYTATKSGMWDAAQIQDIVWSSDQFKDYMNFVKLLIQYAGETTSPFSSQVLKARSNQYAQFYYGILNGGNKLELTSEYANSKVMVDYTDKTYTVGPYKIDLKTGNLSGAVKDARTILYNELAGINAANYPNTVPFATYEISGLDGTNIQFLDKSGNVVSFPYWGEDFYIRYKPNNGVTTITPKIKINYIPRLDGKAMIYHGASASVEGTVDGIYVDINNFKPEDYVNKGTIKLNSNSGAEVNVKVSSYTITETERVDIDPIYDDEGNFLGYGGYRDYVKAFTYRALIEDPYNRLQELMELVIKGYDEEAEGGAFYVTAQSASTDINLGTKDISMELGGNVWLDDIAVKMGGASGVRSDDDPPFAGMEVRLFDENNNLVALTVTNSKGKYHFYKLNPLLKYYVKFVYNGQIYQATYYKYNLTGGYSNAKDEARDSYNSRFANIDSSPENYKMGTEWHKAYAWYTKLAAANGEYINKGTDKNGKILALTFEDAWNKFLELAPQNGSYERAYLQLQNWLISSGVGNSDVLGVIQYIKDCMINASTHVDDPLIQGNYLISYPVYDRFVLEDLNNPTDEIETITLDRTYSYLYTKKSDQSRYVDFGIARREDADIAIQKDLFKATVIVNGKKHDYMYSKKENGDNESWTVEVRASDELYNGNYSYTREIRKSEYLYDGEDESSKNLQVFVTYKILIKNNSSTLYPTINEIVDYYDADQYTFDGVLGSDGKYTFNSYNEYDENGNVKYSYVNSYIGTDGKGTKMENAELTISNRTKFADRDASKTLNSAGYNYSPLYISGIKSVEGTDRLGIDKDNKAYVYITFKANLDNATGKVKLDQDLMTGEITVGKRNIAEINGYSTYYSPYSTRPDYLQNDNSKVDESVADRNAGKVNNLSNPGSLEEIDLTENGDLRSAVNNEVENRLEVDTDKAPNLKLIIDQRDEDTRRLTGFVYEDERTVTNNKAVVGNGIYENGENKVNGVKVELVELVQNVDKDGIHLGSYSGEKVWASEEYDFIDGKLQKVSENNDRYYSGCGISKVIMSGPGILKVTPDTLGVSDGTYSFKSLPAGDFFIRFTYGDSYQNVLVDSDNDVNTLVGSKGLNAKSYNGQDYKTTTYQSGVNQDSSYKGINGFKNYDVQNYTNGTDKSAMYYYDIANSKVFGVSDAKDVYSYRESSNKYSSGADGNTLLNNRAEILNSFESLGTYKYETDAEQKQAQIDKLNALMTNTKMVAQTGVIDTEIEYNSKVTEGQGNNNQKDYIIDDIDLGLQERPKAQLKLNKEITNFKITLSNNQTLFDTTQSVNNLFFAKHDGHKANYSGYKLIGFSIGNNTKSMPELIQAYMDEELMAGSIVEATYTLSVENVGEVDYLDKKFYYTGETQHPDDENWVSTTNAKEVIDYISDKSRYEERYQKEDAKWDIKNITELVPSTAISDEGEVTIDNTKLDNDLVNREYIEDMATYRAIATTEKLSSDLLPTLFNENKSTSSTKLVLSALLSNSENEEFVYNNLAEIIATSNKQGRRMSYSVVGNQEMSNQAYGAETRDDLYTSADLVTPSEIDADSSQKIVILPPTGENKNYIPVIILAIACTLMITVGIILIKKIVLPKAE